MSQPDGSEIPCIVADYFKQQYHITLRCVFSPSITQRHQVVVFFGIVCCFSGVTHFGSLYTALCIFLTVVYIEFFRYPSLPCLQAQPKEKHRYIPMEV